MTFVRSPGHIARDAAPPAGGFRAHVIPLLDKAGEVVLDDGFELQRRPLRERMRQDSALSGMFFARTSRENRFPPIERSKHFVEIGLEDTSVMAVYRLKCRHVGDGDMVGSNANERA